MRKGIIELEGMEFHAYHGCLKKERRDGNSFVVDFKAEADVSKASRSDSIEDTLDYGAVYDIIAREMAVPSDLLENVAGRIVRSIAERFPGLDRFSVRVAKKNPPVAGPTAFSRVTLFYDRAQDDGLTKDSK